MKNRIWLPAKVAFEIFKKSLFGKYVSLTYILQKETKDMYYYVNGKYITHISSGRLEWEENWHVKQNKGAEYEINNT